MAKKKSENGQHKSDQGNGASAENSASIARAGAGEITVTSTTAAKRMMDALTAHLTPERFVAIFEELLHAERTYTDKEGNSYTTPDFNTRLNTAKFGWEAIVGRAIERQHIVSETLGPRSLADLVASAKSSPVMTLELERELEATLQVLKANRKEAK